MGCTRPQHVIYTENGKPNFGRTELLRAAIRLFESGWSLEKVRQKIPEYGHLSCGRCDSCLLRRSQEWAARCLHEMHMHEENCFLTLTYSDLALPRDGNLNHTHIQLFMKKLRFVIAPKKIRYFMCGEYGSKTDRPHYHMLIFGYDFPDKTYWRMCKRKIHRLYRSEQLERLWCYGHSEIGSATYESAGYIARYIVKKIQQDADRSVSSYVRMSTRGGVGEDFFQKYRTDMYPIGSVVLRTGKKISVPRYYAKKMKILEPSVVEEVKQKNKLKAQKREYDITKRRLLDREICTRARLRRLPRE